MKSIILIVAFFAIVFCAYTSAERVVFHGKPAVAQPALHPLMPSVPREAHNINRKFVRPAKLNRVQKAANRAKLCKKAGDSLPICKSSVKRIKNEHVPRLQSNSSTGYLVFGQWDGRKYMVLCCNISNVTIVDCLDTNVAIFAFLFASSINGRLCLVIHI
jgi:hypothetical protein